MSFSSLSKCNCHGSWNGILKQSWRWFRVGHLIVHVESVSWLGESDELGWSIGPNVERIVAWAPSENGSGEDGGRNEWNSAGMATEKFWAGIQTPLYVISGARNQSIWWGRLRFAKWGVGEDLEGPKDLDMYFAYLQISQVAQHE